MTLTSMSPVDSAQATFSAGSSSSSCWSAWSTRWTGTAGSHSTVAASIGSVAKRLRHPWPAPMRSPGFTPSSPAAQTSMPRSALGRALYLAPE